MAMAKIKVSRVAKPIPDAPVISFNDSTNLLSASSPLGDSEIVVSENGGVFTAYAGQINVGNVARVAGYWKFKIKAAQNRTESAVANSPAFTTSSATPDAPTLTQDDTLNTISASHPLGDSEIMVMGADTYYVPYTGTIFVGNVDQPAGYWKFKTKAAAGRNESPVASSGAFTSVASAPTTPDAPTIFADDVANTLDATHALGDSEIVVSENGGGYVQFNGTPIVVGDVDRAAGYWKFKTKLATGRNESPEAPSPAFNKTVAVSGTSYTLTSTQTVSAAIFDESGVMVRTLFSRKTQTAGTYPIVWDGTDDFLQQLPVANYQVKVVANNVTYLMEGVIGNNSLNQRSPTNFSSLDYLSELITTNGKGYFTLGYNEQKPSMAAFAISSPKEKLELFNGHCVQTVDHLCSDGTNVYFTAWDNFLIANSWVFATKVSDNSDVTFSAGTSYQVKNGRFYPSVVDFRTVTAQQSGIAVAGNFLFISYRAENLIRVLNKTTGEFLRSLTFTNANCMVGEGNNIWISYGTNTVQKYPVNTTDGTLGTGGVTLSGLDSPVTLTVNNAGLILVCDGGNSQQIKAYNSGTGGSPSWTLGQLGGMLVTAICAPDRFGFWKIREETGLKEPYAGIGFAPDGSFFVNDPSNKQTKHFDSSRNFITSDSLTAQGKTYSTNVYPGDERRILTNFIEFQDNPSLPVSQSWVQKYNWEGFYKKEYIWQHPIREVAVHPNGRTYGLMRLRVGGLFEWVELIPATGIRYTGVLINETLVAVSVKGDGKIYHFRGYGKDETATWEYKTITFDGSNNPVLSSNWTTITTNSLTSMVQPRLSGGSVAAYQTVQTNKIVCYRGNREPNFEDRGSYHLGLYDPAGKWLWRVLPSDHRNYAGEFPLDYFEIGNNTNGEGSIGISTGRHIFAAYFGEGWDRGSQAAKVWHFYDNGVMLNQFGKTGREFERDPYQNWEFAGNTFSPSVIQYAGNIYYYVNDESAHGGVLRWKISGLDTINEFVVNLTTSFVRTPEVALAGTDLMAGIPFDTNFTVNNITGGWTLQPAPFGGWKAISNHESYSRREPNDLYLQVSNSGAATYTAVKTINTATGLSAWQLAGELTWNDCQPNVADANGLNQYFDVLDNAGKIIVRWQLLISFSTNPSTRTLMANTTAMASAAGDAIRNVAAILQPFSILKSGSSITVSYASYTPVVLSAPFETGANISNPNTLRILFSHNGQWNTYEKFIDLHKFRFNPAP